MSEFNRMAEMGPLMTKAMSQIIRKAAFDIQAQAASTAPHVTGFLQSSVYVVTHDSSTYGDGFQDGGVPLEEIPHPTSETEADVVVAAAYGVYVEFGTANMPAQPYLVPAAEFVKPQLEKAAAALEAKMRELGSL